MQLLPMASSPDGLISARDAVSTKTPGWEVLTTTRNGNVTRGCVGGVQVVCLVFRGVVPLASADSALKDG